VEAFALSVFEKADEEDRAGLADKGTARTFYAGELERTFREPCMLNRGFSREFLRFDGSVRRA
jgi:hypothetical protein